MSSFKRILLLVITIVCPLIVSAQKQHSVTVSGEKMKTFHTNISIDIAKYELEQEMKQELIDQAFGTYVNRTIKSEIKNVDGKSSSDFRSLNLSQTNGDWVRTIDGPHFEFMGIDESLTEYTLKIKLKGEVREIKGNKVEFKAKILRNGTTENCESDRFVSKENFYLLFSAPCSGHVSVYLRDESGYVYYLTPYANMAHDYVDVEAREEVLFYHKDSADPYTRVQAWKLQCSGGVEEHDKMYIIFSPNDYYGPDYKAIPQKGRPDLHVTPVEDFEAWLAKARKQDPKLQVDEKLIIVEPSK